MKYSPHTFYHSFMSNIFLGVDVTLPLLNIKLNQFYDFIIALGTSSRIPTIAMLHLGTCIVPPPCKALKAPKIFIRLYVGFSSCSTSI
jgi:hypothetical protein